MPEISHCIPIGICRQKLWPSLKERSTHSQLGHSQPSQSQPTLTRRGQSVPSPWMINPCYEQHVTYYSEDNVPVNTDTPFQRGFHKDTSSSIKMKVVFCFNRRLEQTAVEGQNTDKGKKVVQWISKCMLYYGKPEMKSKSLIFSSRAPFKPALQNWTSLQKYCTEINE